MCREIADGEFARRSDEGAAGGKRGHAHEGAARTLRQRQPPAGAQRDRDCRPWMAPDRCAQIERSSGMAIAA
jgi:hypothetical protein